MVPVGKHACSACVKTWVLIPGTYIQTAYACNSSGGGVTQADLEFIDQTAYRRTSFWFTERPCLKSTRQRAREGIQHAALGFTCVHTGAHIHKPSCVYHTLPLPTYAPPSYIHHCTHQANSTLYNKSSIWAKCLIQTSIKYLMYVPNIST